MKFCVQFAARFHRIFKCGGSAFLVVLLFATAGRAAEPTPTAVAQMLVKKYGATIVHVSMVVKLNGTVGGRPMPAKEIKRELVATMISPTGLAVVSLASVDIGELLNGRTINTAKGPVKIEMTGAEFTQVRFRLPDGSELPARVVLKDPDLDIAFIKAITPPAKPLASLDLANGASPQLLSTGYMVGRGTSAARGALVVRRADIISIMDKPRKRIVPEFSLASCPMFNEQGKIYGICVSQIENNRSMGSLVLPADDIAEIAKQAAAIPAEPEVESEAKAPAEAAPTPATETTPTAKE